MIFRSFSTHRCTDIETIHFRNKEAAHENPFWIPDFRHFFLWKQWTSSVICGFITNNILMSLKIAIWLRPHQPQDWWDFNELKLEKIQGVNLI